LGSVSPSPYKVALHKSHPEQVIAPEAPRLLIWPVGNNLWAGVFFDALQWGGPVMPLNTDGRSYRILRGKRMVKVVHADASHPHPKKKGGVRRGPDT
jgi:hypothetical protein